MNPRPWFLVGRRGAKHAPTVADECDAFLDGRAAALMQAQGQAVPAWAQVNQLARGSLEQIRSLAETGPSTSSRRSRVASWGGAVALLAEQLLADVHDEADLRALQRSALWPLEADLLDARTHISMSPSELFFVALGCIVDATS